MNERRAIVELFSYYKFKTTMYSIKESQMSSLSRYLFLSIFFSVCGIGIEFLLRTFNVPEYLVPLPSQVIKVFYTDWQLLLNSALVTSLEWFVGVILSVFIGLFLSLTSFYIAFMKSVLSPLLVALQSIPYLIFAPLLMIWFGFGLTAKIIIVILTCSFPIALVMQTDLNTARNEYELIVQMLRFSNLRALFSVYIPASLPGFFNALKISMSYSFGTATLAELMGSEDGLGIYLLHSQSTYRTDKVIAVVLIVITVSVLSTSVVNFVRNRIIFWQNLKEQN